MGKSLKNPPVPLKKAIEFAIEIYSHAGSSVTIKRDEAAKMIGKGANYVKDRFSAAVQYGLFKVSVGEGYTVTPFFKDIYKPLGEDKKREALKTAFCSPPLYQKLITKFKGEKLPSEELLSNLLTRTEYGIQDNASLRAAQIFLENIDYLGLKTKEGFLDMEGNYPSSSLESAGEEDDTFDSADPVENEQYMPEVPIQENRSMKEQNGGVKPPVIEVMHGWNRFSAIHLPPNPTKEDFAAIREDLERLEKRLFPE
jgi:hypothetical protein